MAEAALDERVSYLEGWKEGIDSRLVRIEERIEALDVKVDRFREELSSQFSGQISVLREEMRNEFRDHRRLMFQLFFGGFGFLAVLMTIFKFVG